MMINFRVRYIGDDRADIRNGEVYEATDLVDCTTMYGAKCMLTLRASLKS